MDSFVGHVERLSTYYEKGEEDQFVSAIGTLYAHIPYNADRVTGPITSASRIRTGIGSLQEAQGGERMNGWNPDFADGRDAGDDQFHHYAAYLYMGYYYGSVVGGALSVAQDISPLNASDILLGNIGAMHGEAIASGKLTMSGLPTAIRKRLGGP
jgi:expansin (peptidoglycan-binding protein)